MEEEGILDGCEGLPANGFSSTEAGQESIVGQEQAEGMGEPAFISARQYSLQYMLNSYESQICITKWPHITSNAALTLAGCTQVVWSLDVLSLC